MADRKISDLTALTTPASGDYLPIVDISEAAAASKNKRITIEELFRGVPLGTAAAPSIAIEGDEDTGVFSPGANQLAVATNGTGRLFVDASGNIGVGTSSPVNVGNYNTIHLAGRNATTGGIFRSTSSDNSIIGLFFTDSNGVYTGTDTNHPYRIATNGGERLRVTEAGLVGIGTSAPGTSLDVRGIISLGSSSVANAVIQKSAVPGGSFNLTITSGGGLTSESATTPTDALAGSVIKLLGGDPTTDTFGGGIQYYANGSTSPNGAGVGNQHAFYTRSAANTYTERLRITSAGNVGIGNSSPAELLDVSGAIKHGNVGYIADGDLGFIYTGINNSTYGTVIGTKPGTTYGTSRNFTVSLNPATGPGREVFRIVGQSGRVGIGTSAPAARTEIRQDGSSAVELLRLVNDDTSGAGSTIKFKNFYNSALISSTSNPGFSQGGTLRLQTFNGNGVLNTGLAMDNQGRVGIGTTGPGSLLHLAATGTSTNAEIIIAGTNTNGDASCQARIGATQDGALTSGALTFSTRLSGTTSERARITSAGRVGIGTSSPETKVHIADTTKGIITVSPTSDAGSSDDYAAIRFRSYLTSYGTPAYSEIVGYTDATAARNGIKFLVRDGNTIFNPYEAMRLTSLGRLGIGTTNPYTKLDVRGTSGTTGATVQIVGNSVSSLILGQNAAGGVIRAQGGSGSNALAFWTGGVGDVAASGSGTERARIDSSGRLLVGTSTASVTATQILQGNSGAASGNGKLIFARGTTSPADGLGLGEIAFSDSSHSSSVTILAARDGGTWTSGASQPTRLVFSTTANGASSPTERLRITSAGVLQIADAGNITVGTTTGTKIGTATTQKLGFYNATPVVQPTAVADATDAATVITQLNDLLAKLRTLGIIAT